MLNGRSDGVFSELVLLDHPPRIKVEELVASLGITGGAKADAWCAFGDVSGIQWARVIMYLGICLKGELTVLHVVKLVANYNVARTVGIRYVSRCWEGIDPHHC